MTKLKPPRVAKGLRKYTGLMFRPRSTRPLVFFFDRPTSVCIHSLFVLFSFRAIWTFPDGTTDERIILPFKNNIKPLKPFIKLEEYPLIQ
jgi:hypothetical protein